MHNEKAFRISWDQFHRDNKALAWKLLELNKEWKYIVPITRGGLVPAAIISRELGILTIETLSISSYSQYNNRSELSILKDINDEVKVTKGEGVLVIDDLSDTGRTFQVTKEFLPHAHYATAYVKPQGKQVVDTYITEVSQETWIYLPWDMDLNYQEPINKNHKG